MNRISLRSQAILAAFAVAILTAPERSYASGTAFRIFFEGVLGAVRPMWIPIAVLMIVIAGFSLALSVSEGGLDKARNTVLAVVIGGMLIVLGPVMVSILFQMPNVIITKDGANVALEAVGIARWLASMGGVVGILFIVITALTAVFSFGNDEDSYSKVRRALIHVVFGLGIIGASALISQAVGNGTPNPIIVIIVRYMLIILAIITTIALLVLVYAGLRMVMSYANEESFAQAKSLIVRVLVGLFIILVAYVLVIVVDLVF